MQSFEIGQRVNAREADEIVTVVRFERVGMNDKVVVARANGEQHTMWKDEIEAVSQSTNKLDA